MPVYEYSALDAQGRKTRGVVDADGPPTARQKLRAAGVFPVALKEVEMAAKASSPSISWQFKRVRPSEVTAMTRQLATLTGAGFPLVAALESLIPQTVSHTFKTRMTRIKDAIVEGNSFAGALSLYPDLFPPVYLSMVQAGESSGTLEIVLERLADIAEKQEALRNRLRSALAYPVLMTMVGVMVLFFLLVYIVPGITKIFSEMNQVLPGPTRALIFISKMSQTYWWAGILAILFGLLVFRGLSRTDKGRRFLDNLLLAVPGIGALNRKLITARVTRTLGSLLENGVTLISALNIVKNIAGNRLYFDAIEEAASNVGKGQGLSEALSVSGVFPPLALQMIQVGEQSGELETMLGRITTVFEQEVESRVLALTAMLEPVMILVMGAMVGFVVLSICLPILEMNQLVR
ncbi:MAG: type II secretion system inner membrane protein GspF [Desulfobacterales bacterium]|nr:type II secretion system inner membrane protein GspF [Desulfobacterales bacterium]